MKRVVAFALKQQALMLAIFVFVCAAGLVSFTRLNIEAYPDPVPPLVDIGTQNPGQSAEEIERYVTIPLEIQMAGLPHIASIRTISLFGLSDVKLQFTYDVSYEQAEQLAINALGGRHRCRAPPSRKSRPGARLARSSVTGSSVRPDIP
jgi:cobalt-zinc-cadmium resistance protein CzcA